jgi:hypothetical protein
MVLALKLFSIVTLKRNNQDIPMHWRLSRIQQLLFSLKLQTSQDDSAVVFLG